ncbi:MAG: DUF3341 domain-containing protein [Myxococcota bacterium]
MAGNIYGVIAEFHTPGELYHAAEAVRKANYTEFDCYTPFPVHGLEKAMGVPASKVPWIVLGGGITGFSAGLALQSYTSVVDLKFMNEVFGAESVITSMFKGMADIIGWGYPMIIGGKPFFSYQAFVPVTFELTILLSAFGAIFGMLALNRLPMFYHPVFKHPRFRRATDDRFFLTIESKDREFEVNKVRTFLESIGGGHVTVLEA